MRLFKNFKEIKSSGAIHESVIESIQKKGTIGYSEIPIHHLGPLIFNLEKQLKYINIEIKNRSGNDFYQDYRIGVQLHSVGRLKEAFPFLLNSVKINENFYLAWLELGIILIKLGKLSESKPLLLKSLSIQEHESAWMHLALVELSEKNTEKAFNFFERASALNPKNADIYFNYGQALKSLGDMTQAIKMLQKAGELNPIYKNV